MVPILFLIFNRKDITQEAFKSIRKYKPAKLYIAADGPRKSKTGETVLCEQTRKAVMEMIDWPCEVKTLFRDDNLGCAKAVSSAIDWFFENEEFGVIIEDDIVVSQDFFSFAEELDSRYRDDNRIMSINAQYIGREKIFDSSYSFSAMASPWGWATWRRAWKYMDMKMSLFPYNSLKKHISSFGLFKGFMLYFYYWNHDYKLITSGGDISSWATRWAFNVFANNGLVVIPSKNLAINIGCAGFEGTHYSKDDKDLYSYMKLEDMSGGIVHPNRIVRNKKLLKLENQDFFRIRFVGLKKKIKNYFRLR